MAWTEEGIDTLEELLPNDTYQVEDTGKQKVIATAWDMSHQVVFTWGRDNQKVILKANGIELQVTDLATLKRFKWFQEKPANPMQRRDAPPT